MREGAIQHERRRSIRMARGEEDVHRAAFRQAEQRRALAADGVHHGPDVVHALLERRRSIVRQRIGQAGPAFVDEDEPREAREPPKKARERRHFPRRLDVAHPTGDEHEIGPVADHLICDVVRAVPGIARLRFHRALRGHTAPPDLNQIDVT
jgi:hypothetical protein